MAHSDIPRIIQSTPAAMNELRSVQDLLETVDYRLESMDAFAVFPGLGENIRAISAVNAWENNEHASHLLVAGTHPAEEHQPPLDLDGLQEPPFNLRRISGVETQVTAQHTRDQALWLVDRIRTLKIGKTALFVSDWHLPRAYSTVIKTLRDEGLDEEYAIYPAIVRVSPESIIPETGASVEDMEHGEAERIVRYRGIGHVATQEELREYQDWLNQQPL